ncbi:MAG: glycopeptide resistance accessory protein VanW [Clostridium sp.]|nr:glycopeptide resistance accessory protein VanW [Clostridium sp.]
MKRKRLTQLFPWLLPLRKKQRIFCFYMKMKFDRNHYATKQFNTLLPYRLFSSDCPMYNRETGFDMVYQDNKVFNLKLAAKTLNNLVIRPGETFSFWETVRYADKNTPYKDGLVVSNGILQALPGGGLCQMSNLLFWLFLHTPLTIMERHGHRIKDFPGPQSDAPIGVDAAVSEGWLDLKVKNNTTHTFQIIISFSDDSICGSILTDMEPTTAYQIVNGRTFYYRDNDNIFEEVDVIQNLVSIHNNEHISTKILYRNHCKIGYQLPEGTIVNELC